MVLPKMQLSAYKTSSMKVNWKQIALYILRIVELVITGAAGGAMTQL